MQNPAKNILRNHLLQSEGKSECPTLEVAVIDGGDLLFHISWNSKDSYHKIAGKYLKYIRDHFKQKTICVVFDGDSDPNSTKGEEHSRRGKGSSSASVNIKNVKAKPTCSKILFWKNRHNKILLMYLLKSTFMKAGITLKQSQRDTKVMICKTDLELAEEGKAVQVSGTDTDLLAILMHHGKENMKLFFHTIFKTDNQPKTREKVMW